MLDRRAVIGSGAALAGVALTSSAAAEATASGRDSMGAMNFDAYVDKCMAAHRQCVETATYAIGQDRSAESAKRIAILLDCAELCQVTANSMLRKSSQHALLCEACARLCENCAEACLSKDSDAVMRNCATICRDCARACRDMASMRM
ncbi:four-helix bundle copper-binding protein [Novosphingobium sp. CECT 9465]|uniref:four-helix bundle copper-binding protein n=1 Tax=Novosphingobium sp. CECT 9465 TaxID=2829794 RepID=UPI001E4F39C6|nr:four-helix bundle copper-binding protein [Novosphingobium sp. CECT 9465]CAH0498993.1 hypothetical protein NVSP9465_04089 [Novosphingobium sp. CECT 9465]